jgi:hypothetical protein
MSIRIKIYALDFLEMCDQYPKVKTAIMSVRHVAKVSKRHVEKAYALPAL